MAFAGSGADSTQTAARLSRVRFERIADDICIVGYPATRVEVSE